MALPMPETVAKPPHACCPRGSWSPLSQFGALRLAVSCRLDGRHGHWSLSVGTEGGHPLVSGGRQACEVCSTEGDSPLVVLLAARALLLSHRPPARPRSAPDSSHRQMSPFF